MEYLLHNRTWTFIRDVPTDGILISRWILPPLDAVFPMDEGGKIGAK